MPFFFKKKGIAYTKIKQNYIMKKIHTKLYTEKSELFGIIFSKLCSDDDNFLFTSWSPCFFIFTTHWSCPCLG